MKTVPTNDEQLRAAVSTRYAKTALRVAGPNNQLTLMPVALPPAVQRMRLLLPIPV